MPQSSKLSERDQILELRYSILILQKIYRDSKQNITIRFSRKILFMRLCDFELGRYFESVPGRIKGSFSHLFSPGTHFSFILQCLQTSCTVHYGIIVFCILKEAAAQYLSVKLFCQRLYLLLGALSLSLELGEIIHFLGPGFGHIVSGSGKAALCRHRH